MTAPPLTVLLPVRNAEATLDAALASLAAQSIDRFEVLVVDDGSTDASRDIVHEWRDRLPGLTVLERAHRGIATSLSEGLERARTTFIARMDADDIARPARLERQLELLEERAEIVLCGTHVRIVSDEGTPGAGMLRYADWIARVHSTEDVLRERFIECPIVHPTFCFRREAVLARGGYRVGDFAEDYDLVMRLAAAGDGMANVPEELLDWRDSETRLSRTHSAYTWQAFQRTKGHYLAKHLGKRPVILWGAGKVGRYLSRELIRNGADVRALIDIDERKWGRIVRDREVHPPSFVEGPREELIVGAVGTLGARAVIREELTGRGCVEGPDFIMAA